MRRFDVAVIGGGFAGLTLTRHLLRARPGLAVAVLDPGALPCSPARRSVGESTVEVASWYLGERLGLRDHLDREHITKFGLRWWLGGDPRDITTRLEMGPLDAVPGHEHETPPLEPRTFQMHRGRLEHHLACGVLDAGATLLDRARVLAWTPGDVDDTLHFERAGVEDVVHARWIVDATGFTRAGLLDGLPLQLVPHTISALWGWVDERVDPTRWSDAPAFAARTRSAVRWSSTQHFLGRGYWSWCIPLSDGGTSMGLVVDRKLHQNLDDAAAMHRFWQAHEPQEFARGAHAIAPHNFRAIQASWRAPFVRERRAATGAALGFFDPFYSSGHDITSIAHELLVPQILDHLEGRPLALRFANELLASFMRQLEATYVDAYAIFGDPTVASVKFAWDQLVYFGWLAALVRGGKIGDLEWMMQARPLSDRVHRLNLRVQNVLRAWAARRTPSAPVRDVVDLSHLDSVMRCFIALRDPEGLLPRLQQHVASFESFALAILERACEDLGQPLPDEPLDPYGLELDPTRQPTAGLFNYRRGRRAEDRERRDLSRISRPAP